MEPEKFNEHEKSIQTPNNEHQNNVVNSNQELSIESITVSQRDLMIDDELEVTVIGTPYLKCYFSIEGIFEAEMIEMQEHSDQRGKYTGSYTIMHGDHVRNATLNVTLINENEEMLIAQSDEILNINASEKELDDGTINLRVAWWGSEERHNLTLRAIEMFEEQYPDIKIIPEYQSWTEYWRRLENQSMDGNLPDIIQLDIPMLKEFHDRGLIKELDTNFLEITDVNTNLIRDTTIDNRLYGIGLGLSAYALVINTDIFSLADVPLPTERWTWQEFEEITKQIRSVAELYGVGDSLHSYQSYITWLQGRGFFPYSSEGIGNDDQNIENIEFFDMILRMEEAGSKPTVEMANAQAYLNVEDNLFSKQEAATALMWTHTIPDLGDDYVLDLKPTPTDNPSINSNFITTMCWAINTHTTSETAALKFINFFVNSLEANQILKAERGVPISQNIRNQLLPSLKSNQAKIFQFIESVTDENRNPMKYSIEMWDNSIKKVFGRVIEKISNHKITPVQGIYVLKEKTRTIRADSLYENSNERITPIWSVPWWSNNIFPLTHEVPLKVLIKFNDSKVSRPINPGPIPPNYAHTWALDVKNISKFKFKFRKQKDIQLYWDPSGVGDRITIINSNNDVLQTFKSLADIKNKVIDLGKGKPSAHDKHYRPYKRIYMILETSNDDYKRNFYLSTFQNVNVNSNKAEILLLDDSINYNAIGSFLTVLDQYSNKMKVDPPWNPNGKHTVTGKGIKTCKKPLRSDGWYLVGKSLKNIEKGFHFLMYYNERESKIRLYLFRIQLPSTTAYKISLSLISRAKDYWEPLEGAIFPVHPNPNKWSEGTGLVSVWPNYRWICIDFPILYPMVKNFSSLKSPNLPTRAKHHYYSIYEDQFEETRTNIRIQVGVQPLDYGDFVGTFKGSAYGDAIQKIGGGPTFQSSLDQFTSALKGAADNLMVGKDAYKLGADFQGYFEGVYKNEMKKDPSKRNQVLLSMFKPIANAGAAAFGGPLALVGVWLNMVGGFLAGESEPIILAIELALKGIIKGKVTISKQKETIDIYFPGRFSIADAFFQGTNKSNYDELETLIPTYDRAIGLIGYQYNPGEIKFNVYREDRKHSILDSYSPFLFPVDPIIEQHNITSLSQKELINKYATWKVPKLLPLIYNPYSEIHMIKSGTLGTTTIMRQVKELHLHERDIVYHFNHSLPYHLKCGIKDKTCLNHKLIASGKPRIYVKIFDSSKDVFLIRSPESQKFHTHNGYIKSPNGTLLEVEMTNNRLVPKTYKTFTKDEKDLQNAKVQFSYMVKYSNTNLSGEFKEFNYTDPAPIHDIIYYWDVSYIYYGKSRQDQNNNKIPFLINTLHMKSPVQMNYIRDIYDYEDFPDEERKFSYRKKFNFKSSMLKS